MTDCSNGIYPCECTQCMIIKRESFRLRGENLRRLIKEAWSEIDQLIAHWISHTCAECGQEPRLPTKEFPNIMKLGKELYSNE